MDGRQVAPVRRDKERAAVFVGRHSIEVGWGDCDPARIVFRDGQKITLRCR